jgi:hypothetical protein
VEQQQLVHVHLTPASVATLISQARDDFFYSVFFNLFSPRYGHGFALVDSFGAACVRVRFPLQQLGSSLAHALSRRSAF